MLPDLFVKPLAIGAAILAALLGAGLAVQSYRLNSARTEIAEARTDWDRATIAALRRAADDTERWHSAAQAAKDGRDEAYKQIAALDRDVADLRARNVGLRNDLARYARGPNDDTATACQARAATLAGLLEEGRRLAATGAGLVVEGRRFAADLDAVGTAWPTNR